MSDFKATKDVAQYLMTKLACSVCEDVPGPSGDRKNRYACSNGHMVCEKCKSGKCSCESESFNGPLGHIEKLMDKSHWHYCCHFKLGCQDVFEKRILDEHQKTCIYRQIKCPGTNCGKQVAFKDIIDHVGNDHKTWNNAAATKVDGKTFILSYDKDTIDVTKK